MSYHTLIQSSHFDIWKQIMITSNHGTEKAKDHQKANPDDPSFGLHNEIFFYQGLHDFAFVYFVT